MEVSIFTAKQRVASGYKIAGKTLGDGGQKSPQSDDQYKPPLNDKLGSTPAV